MPFSLVMSWAYRSTLPVALTVRPVGSVVASMMLSSTGAVVPRAVMVPRRSQLAPSRTSSVDRKLISGWASACRKSADVR